MQERDNVLRILKETLEALKRENVLKLRDLSGQTVHTSSITQDPDNIAVAVVIYSLSKIIEQQGYRQKPGWDKFYNNAIMQLEHSVDALKKGDDIHLSRHLESINKRISGMSSKFKAYIQDVFAKASINKASKIYEHGISMGKTASLLGVSQYELANYAGTKDISDAPLGNTLSVKDRIKLAMGMFEK